MMTTVAHPAAGSAGRATRDRHTGTVVAGVVVMALGIGALSGPGMTTPATLGPLGWLMLAGGVAHLAHALRTREDEHNPLLPSLVGMLYAAGGAVVLLRPLAAATTWMLAAVLSTVGVVRFAAALASPAPDRGAWMLHGLAAVGAGILVWYGWPSSAAWMVAACVGLDLLAGGWYLVSRGLAGDRAGKEGAERR